MKEFGLPKSSRLRSAREFAAVYDRRCRAGDRHLLVFAKQNELGFPRLGLSVSKKHGNAVARNRLKRLLREAFRLSQTEIDQGVDFILIPRQNSGGDLRDFRQSFQRLANRLVRQLLRGNSP